MSSFKEKVEKNFNKELEEDHPEPQHIPPPPMDIECQQDPPPPHTFLSYPPPPRRSGVYVPTAFFILFVLIFLFESSVLFIYTLVALYNTVPTALVPMNALPMGCNCGPVADHLPVNVAPTVYAPSAIANPATITQTMNRDVTITVTATPSTSISTAEPTASVNAGISAIIGALTKTTPTMQTVTAPIPTITVLSTASPSQSVITMTVLSTTDAPRPTVTSTALVTARSTDESGEGNQSR